MSVTVIICTVSIISAVIVLSVMKKSRHFFRSLILSGIVGITALYAVNAAGTFTGVMLSVNRLTLASGAVFGIPGIIAHLIVKTLLKM